MTTLASIDAAANYISRGWAPIPLPPKSKAPTIIGWQRLRITEADLPKYFTDGCNVGVLLGSPSGNLVDVDLDHPTALALADEYLPATDAVFGRQSKRRSHRLYVVTGDVKTVRYQATGHGMLVELRSTGTQTVMPGSIHPSGEPITWDSDGEPAVVPAGLLAAAVAALADAVRERLGIVPREPHKPAAVYEPHNAGDKSDNVVRARSYISALPPAIQGANGSRDLLRAACECVRFDLTDDESFALLSEFSERCVPPWSEAELRHAIDSAAKKVDEANQRGVRNRADWQAAVAPTIDIDWANFGNEGTSQQAPAAPTTPTALATAPAAAAAARFPLELIDAAPAFLRDFVEHCVLTARRPQPELALLVGCAVLGTLVGRKITDAAGTRANIYCVGLAPSGAGKEHARRIARELFAGIGRSSALCATFTSASAIVSRLEAYADSLSLVDEFGSYLESVTSDRSSSHQRGVLPKLMEAFTSSGSVLVGDSYANAKERPTITVADPNLNMAACSTPGRFFSALASGHALDGWLNRLIVAPVSDDLPPRRVPVSRPLPASLIDHAAYWSAFDGGGEADLLPSPIIIPTSQQADSILSAFSTECDDHARGADDVVRGLWVRTAEKADKLALVAAAASGTDGIEITAAAAQWACRLAEWTTRFVVDAVDRHVADSRHAANVKAVANIIRKAGSIPRRELIRLLDHRHKTKEVNEIVGELIDAGKVVVASEKTGGRPKEVLTWTSVP